MTHTQNPRLLARIAGVVYLLITACALFAYLYVRGQIMVPGDMAASAANIVSQERLYRIGLTSAVIVVMLNLPLGLLLFELLKVVNPRIALLALLFIIVSTTIEALNVINYIAPLFTMTLPEFSKAFDTAQLQALVRGANRTWGYTFSGSLTFFGAFCVLTGWLIVKSTFLPKVIGMLMMAAGLCYWINGAVTFLDLPDVPFIFRVTQVAEVSLALWLLVFGVNEARWRAQALAAQPMRE